MSIKKIAKLAGVSTATVSRVLNNPDYHCQDAGARDRIWKAAMEINYTPNEAARNLKRGQIQIEKTRYIHVLMTRTERNNADPFFSEMLHVVESEIHKQMHILSKVWYMSLFSDDRQCRLKNLTKIVDELYEETEGKCDGLIIIGRCNVEALKKIKRRFVNVVSINRNSTNFEVDEVTCDGKKIAEKATEYLIELGHTEIGYVGECRHEKRYQGYVDAMKKHGLEPAVSYIYETKQTEEAGYEVMQKILKTEYWPTGIYCANDITAIGMLKALRKSRKKHITISIVSSDDIEQAQYTIPMLTTVALPKYEMGKFAVSLLLDRINKEHSSVITMEFEGQLKIRESCSDLKDSSIAYYI
ncbi:LacI family DNA-binding transcriptional regulator [Roseburia sp. 831b]|uniref:LacI family DNA-binding transcriptional regulator n=1 Tax=Roseburia sp. 831b TaxID=1261635 RepID=UPI000951C307|nr:LacI family DNA-binding transcriptional regulator [Roseburia sp. 831b]WVK73311.1 LacI family DNA-binding transcriptional regulator [Roseburia sp. 831b]